jgi:hypothetical protein
VFSGRSELAVSVTVICSRSRGQHCAFHTTTVPAAVQRRSLFGTISYCISIVYYWSKSHARGHDCGEKREGGTCHGRLVRGEDETCPVSTGVQGKPRHLVRRAAERVVLCCEQRREHSDDRAQRGCVVL